MQELEYPDGHVSPSIYVAMPLTRLSDGLSEQQSAALQGAPRGNPGSVHSVASAAGRQRTQGWQGGLEAGCKRTSPCTGPPAPAVPHRIQSNCVDVRSCRQCSAKLQRRGCQVLECAIRCAWAAWRR